MSRAVLAWLALCGSLAAPLPARGEGTEDGGDGRGTWGRGRAGAPAKSESKCAGDLGGGSHQGAAVWALLFSLYIRKEKKKKIILISAFEIEVGGLSILRHILF